MMMRSTHSTWRLARAFTLVEMLVVVAIIGVLAGLLLPALSSAREQGRRTACTSNLDQIGKSIAIYCTNNNDYLPSYPGYGLVQANMHPNDPFDPLFNYAGHQGVSRHMVIGYSREFDPGVDPLVAGDDNFMPVGLGMLLESGYLTNPKVLDCPSMRDVIRTYYGAGEYEYNPSVWSLLGGALGNSFVDGDGTGLRQTPTSGVGRVTGILSSYSYRNMPFYSLVEPDNVDDYPTSYPVPDWTWTGAPLPDNAAYFSNIPYGGKSLPEGEWLAEWVLQDTMPPVAAQFMTPPFKTRRALKDRAICSDTFDYSDPAAGGGFDDDGGLVSKHHKRGYHILFGDNHVEWMEDGGDKIKHWTDWDTTTGIDGIDDLTISSPTSQKVWNRFDRLVGIDVR